MKIENIEKACELNKELKEIEEILKLQPDKDELLSSVLLLFHDNKKYNIYSFLTIIKDDVQYLNFCFSCK